eukprot:TRINITY_DN662_c0_g1_i1.p1 TRINITY_DN662_c0_g1~~TRINITY_DN662_c0_g1_i1.p1  ORF type:complete len:690 (+),score=156.10 TRINITY_DN662_c0_g1_i1:38-2107(+)
MSTRGNNTSAVPNTNGDDRLNSLMSLMDKHEAPPQRPPTLGPEAVVHFLAGLKDRSNIEVEARAGLLRGDGFTPGVIKEDFVGLQTHLKSYMGIPIITDETDYIYDNMRVAYDKANARCLRAMDKKTLFNFEVATGLAYDYRVSIAKETPLICPPKLPDGHKYIREKLRMTFRDKHWKVDLTEVQSTFVAHDLQSNNNTTYEVEFEIYSETVVQFGTSLPAMDFVKAFLSLVRTTISHIQTSAIHSFPEIMLDKIEDINELDSLRDMVLECLDHEDIRGRETFPGTMPIGFSKRYIPGIQASGFEYYVSEKTDGLRYFLLITKDGPFLADRRFDFYLVQGFQLLMDIFATEEEYTLLDGEMVRHIKTGKPMYMIFDVLRVVTAGSVVKAVLSERLKFISSIVQNYREIASKLNPDTLPFELIGKNFLKKSGLDQIFKSIHQKDNGEGVIERVYADGKRCHHTDGLIFTPNLPYLAYTAQQVMKWKYVDKLTIDFKLKMRNGRWFLMCQGTEGKDIECREANFSKSDADHITRDRLRSRDRENMVIECSFDLKTGMWKYHGPRPDKNKANFITIVIDTMEVVAENITPEELRYRIPRDLKHDDWEMRLSRFRSDVSKGGANHHPAPSSSSSGSNPTFSPPLKRQMTHHTPHEDTDTVQKTSAPQTFTLTHIPTTSNTNPHQQHQHHHVQH